MDRTRKYHPEWGNSITKEHTWYALTYKWILAPKLGIPKIQLTDHMKLKIRKTKMWMLWFFLEGGAKHPWVETERQNVEQRLNEKSVRDCPICLTIPYSVITPRCYCGCQQELVKNKNFYWTLLHPRAWPLPSRDCSRNTPELFTPECIPELLTLEFEPSQLKTDPRTFLR